jgi:Fe-S cluster assembly protein SufD
MNQDMVSADIHNRIDLLEDWFNPEAVTIFGVKDLDEFRHKAWIDFKALPWPMKKNNGWLKVDLKPIPFEKMKEMHLGGKKIKTEIDFDTPEVKRPKDFYIGSLFDAAKQKPEVLAQAYTHLLDSRQDKFAAMTAAYAENGWFVYIPRDENAGKPIRITITQEDDSLDLINNLIWLEPGATAVMILEVKRGRKYQGTQLLLDNLGIHLGEGASLALIELRDEGDRSWHISHELARLEERSKLEWIVSCTGSRFTKQFMQVDLVGEGASARIASIYTADGDQELEFNTRQNHLSPKTNSDLLFKGVMMGKSRSFFSGMIHVASGAVKSDGYQLNRNLMLGSEAHTDSKPGLEILADDVRCSHGATIGKIDPEELFYLQSRGLDAGDARRLIVRGFLNPVIDLITGMPDRKKVRDQVKRKLAGL